VVVLPTPPFWFTMEMILAMSVRSVVLDFVLRALDSFAEQVLCPSSAAGVEQQVVPAC